jgi:hypothetical protein
MVDVDPDDLETCTCDFPALFFVNGTMPWSP